VPAPVALAPAPAPAATGKMPTELLQKNTCTACHAPDRKLVGPSWSDVAKKHAGQADAIALKIRQGSSGAWGNIPMPPQNISAEEANQIAKWLSEGAAP
jgi:cytochrome c551/c552